MKKNYLLLIALTIAVLQLNAQPHLMNYQGVARDQNGQVLANQKISLQIHIISGAANGSVDYTEIHQTETGNQGVFHIQIGGGTPLYGNFPELTWATSDHFIRIEMDIDGGRNFRNMGTTQLLSVPYAFHAQTAGELVYDLDDLLKNRNAGVPANSWSLFGNRKTDPDQDKFGTTDSQDLVFVTNNEERMRIYSTGNIKIAQSLDIGGNLRVRGDSVIIDHNLFVGDTTYTRSLYVKDNVNDGGFLATFENENNNHGDGINIILGKPRANNGLPDLGVSPEITKAQMENMKKLISNSATKTEKLGILGNLIQEGIEEDVQTFGGLAVGVGNMVVDFINDQLKLPLNIVPIGVTVFPGFSATIAGYGLNIPSYSIGPYALPGIPEINLSLINVDEIPLTDMEFWGIPNIRLTDVVSDPLSNHNEFIRFSDVSNQKMGAIRAESVSDWTSNHLTPTYLMGLRKAFTSAVDKKHGKYHFKQEISQAVNSYKNIGVEYSSGNGDYAEWLKRLNPDEYISAGDIVAVVGGEITKDLSNAEQVMAVSAHPIVLGNVPEEGQKHTGNNVAFLGQIPVKIMGPVSSGDYIVGKGDIPGYGVAISQENMTIRDFRYAVGRSWETNPDTGPKMINTVVGVHNGDYLKILQTYEQRLSQSENRLDDIENKVRQLTGLVNIEE